MSSLYILEIRPLSEVSLANMFSHTVGSLFTLMGLAGVGWRDGEKMQTTVIE